MRFHPPPPSKGGDFREYMSPFKLWAISEEQTGQKFQL